MGLLSLASQLIRPFQKSSQIGGRRSVERVCRFEELEPRIALSATPGPTITVGATYTEQSAPESAGDRFEVAWVGGAPGTELTHLTISGDQDGSGGLSLGDVFFDHSAGGPGAGDFSAFNILPESTVTAAQITSFAITNGGTTLQLQISGWHAGDKLVFTIDVDEQDNVPNTQVEGAEFEPSHVTATFVTADGSYQDLTGGGNPQGVYHDAYSLPGNLAALLTADSGIEEDDPRAGLTFNTAQTPNPVHISGTVYHDYDLDSNLDGSEVGLSGVQLELWVKDGANFVFTGQTTNTDVNGHYAFTSEDPGQFQVRESQPAGYFSTTPNVLTTVYLNPGQSSINNDFGEALPGTLSGHVYEDNNDNGLINGGEAGINNVLVTLTDSGGGTHTTHTNGSGFYQFTNLDPTLTYTLSETQPASYIDGKDTVGTLGAGATTNDVFHTVAFSHSGDSGSDYDYGEIQPASLTGHVFVDKNGDCEQQEGEQGIEGVKIELWDASGNPVLDGGGNPIVTFTDADGHFAFNNLDPRIEYQIHEVQPAAYIDSGEHVGTAGGSLLVNDVISEIHLQPGQHAEDYHFCEVERPSIEGHVFVDPNGDCEQQPGEPGIGGVRIELWDASGNPVLDGAGNPIFTLTDADGHWKFTGLDAGVAYQIREVQPTAYLDSGEHVGTAGGSLLVNDVISEITLAGGEHATDYHFCEVERPSISGYVFQDGPPIVLLAGQSPASVNPYAVRDGVKTPDDAPLAGVTLRLGDGSGNFLTDGGGNFIETVTDANGYYEFTGLDAGTYTVYQIQPSGYLDSLDTPGTTGGVAANPASLGNPGLVGIPHNMDAIAQVTVLGGQHSEQNNFSEVALNQLPPPPPPPPSYPPPPPGTPPVTLAASQLGPGPGLAPPLAPPGGPASNIVFYGGGSPISAPVGPGYTFHLSVTDAGRPRGEFQTAAFSTEEAVRNAGLLNFNVFSQEHAQMDGAHWMFAKSSVAPVDVQFIFGSPDGIPVTGDFNGDGASEVGIYRRGEWFIDVNGNGVWDENDLYAKLGSEKELPITGDWDGDGKTDIGIFGPEWASDPRAIMAETGLPDRANEGPRGAKHNLPPPAEMANAEKRILKFTAAGQERADVIDHVFYYGKGTDIPVAGDWNGDGVATIGVFHDGTWILDDNGDGRWQQGESLVHFGQAGDIPVVGDWNGDGIDDLAVYRQGTWILDTNGDHQIDAADRVEHLGGASDKPVVGDWDGDGKDEIGLYRQGGQVRKADGSSVTPNSPTTR